MHQIFPKDFTKAHNETIIKVDGIKLSTFFI